MDQSKLISLALTERKKEGQERREIGRKEKREGESDRERERKKKTE